MVLLSALCLAPPPTCPSSQLGLHGALGCMCVGGRGGLVGVVVVEFAGAFSLLFCWDIRVQGTSELGSCEWPTCRLSQWNLSSGKKWWWCYGNVIRRSSVLWALAKTLYQADIQLQLLLEKVLIEQGFPTFLRIADWSRSRNSFADRRTPINLALGSWTWTDSWGLVGECFIF